MQNDIDTDEVSVSAFPKISVFGVGGAGINAVNNLILSQLDNIKFVVANTDCQSLMNSLAGTKIQLGAKCTKGLGAGSKPEVGKQAAEEACDIIKRELSGTDMVFIATGMGGGTGTGASPVIAKMAKDMGILTVLIAVKPFLFEGKKRMVTANRGVEELEKIADTLIVIENQKLLEANNDITVAESYAIADGILRQAVYCVVNILLKHGFQNRDFADIKTVLSSAGRAIIGYGEDVDPLEATKLAINNQILENNSIHGAKNILVNISGNRNIKSSDIEKIINKIRDEAKINEDDDPNVIFGTVFDEAIGNNIRVSVIAAGLEKNMLNINKTKDIDCKKEKQDEELKDIVDDNDKNITEMKKIEAPVFVNPLNEDDLTNDESFNLNIQETDDNVTPFYNTFFTDIKKKKVNKENNRINNSKDDQNLDKKEKEISLFDSSNRNSRKNFLSRILDTISNVPDGKNYDNEIEDSEEDDDYIYNTPTIKRKIG